MTKQQLDTLKDMIADMNKQQDNYDNDGSNGSATLAMLDKYISMLQTIIDVQVGN